MNSEERKKGPRILHRSANGFFVLNDNNDKPSKYQKDSDGVYKSTGTSLNTEREIYSSRSRSEQISTRERSKSRTGRRERSSSRSRTEQPSGRFEEAQMRYDEVMRKNDRSLATRRPSRGRSESEDQSPKSSRARSRARPSESQRNGDVNRALDSPPSRSRRPSERQRSNEQEVGNQRKRLEDENRLRQRAEGRSQSRGPAGRRERRKPSTDESEGIQPSSLAANESPRRERYRRNPSVDEPAGGRESSFSSRKMSAPTTETASREVRAVERQRPSAADANSRREGRERRTRTDGDWTQTRNRSRPSNEGVTSSKISPTISSNNQSPTEVSPLTRTRPGWARSRTNSKISTGSNSDAASPTPMDPVLRDDEIPLTEQEKEDLENNRKFLAQKKAEKRAADKLEAEMVQIEREKKALADKQNRGSVSSQKSLISSSSPDPSILVSDYLYALLTTIRNDKIKSPVPDDFRDIDLYENYKSTVKTSFQEMIVRMVKYRFIKSSERQEDNSVKISLLVMEASKLLAKDGKSRNAYCTIEFGDLNSKKKKKALFQTDVIENSLNPVWNQRLTIEASSMEDSIRIQVIDKRKDDFLGQTIIRMADIIKTAGKEGRYEKWLELGDREKTGKLIGGKDKYVGGQILIGGKLDNGLKNKVGKNHNEIQSLLASLDVDNRALYDILCRGCVTLDIFTPKDAGSSILSPESITILKIWANTWNISTEYRFIGYLKAIFEKHVNGDVSIAQLRDDVKIFYSMVSKSKPGRYEFELSLDLVDKISDHCTEQVTNYKDAFPKNKPAGALEDTIFVLRVVHNFPGFRDRHPNMPNSFRDELKYMLTNSALSKFQNFKQQAAPENSSNVTSIIDGVCLLADLVSEEIELDITYFKAPFSTEIDVVRLTAEIYLKNFSICLEDYDEILSTDEALRDGAPAVFELYKVVRNLAQSHSQTVPGLNNMSVSYIENWFAPFIFRWLKQLSKKTVVWVDKAILADNFEPVGQSRDGTPGHSSSVTDIFSALFSELRLFDDLEWSDPTKNAQFYQEFSKTMNAALENYCEKLTAAEKEAPATTTVAAYAQNLLGSKANNLKDIESKSCAKLRNIAYATGKIKEMYKMMDVPNVMKLTHQISKRKSMASNDLITGAFNIGICYGENIKGTSSSGTSNPYVLIKVPENTETFPESDLLTRKNGDDDLPILPVKLTGSQCELCRSRVLLDNLNPSWDENFSVILPPVEKLELVVYSKNLFTSDEVAGTAEIDLGLTSKLRKKLGDHQIHDVYVDLEPQGRVLIRLTLEGDEEDIGYWFRRTNERLIRTRDFIMRTITEKITPSIEKAIKDGVKENENVPLPSESMFKAFQTAVQYAAVQYSDKTSKGHDVHKEISDRTIDELLGPTMEYLEKNLITLCDQLPAQFAKNIIEKLWEETLHISINSLIPQLYGLHAQKPLLVVQTSFVEKSVKLLRDFFNGGGGEFGIPYDKLNSPLYFSLQELLKFYHKNISQIKREYELSFAEGKEKELLLRLLRLLSEGNDEEKGWFVTQLSKRKNKK